jgi:hypothetical protein
LSSFKLSQITVENTKAWKLLNLTSSSDRKIPGYTKLKSTKPATAPKMSAKDSGMRGHKRKTEVLEGDSYFTENVLLSLEDEVSGFLELWLHTARERTIGTLLRIVLG